MVVKATTIPVVAADSGQVMWAKRCQREAPSTAADSYSSAGMACSPAM